MKLDVNGAIVADPTAAAISSAIDARDGEKNWRLSLTRPDGFYLEVAPSEIGTSDMLALVNGNAERSLRHVADRPVAPEEAKAVLADFLRGGAAWRTHWDGSGERASDRTTSGFEEFSQETWKWVAGLIALGSGIFFFTESAAFLFIGLGLGLLVLVAVKTSREIRVRRWPKAPGTITRSDLQARVRKFRLEAARLDNIPAVEYRFAVAGRRFVGTRIGLNTEFSGVDVGALIAKYPVGAVVQVAYNPKNPVDCLLDPTANKGIALDFIKLAAMLAGAAAALYYGSAFLSKWIAQHFPEANAPHAMLAFGIGALLLVIHMWNVARASAPPQQAPRVTGKVVVSEVEAIAHDSGGPRPRLGPSIRYQPTIEVSYILSGAHYAIRSAIPDEQLGASTPETAKAQLAAYPVGRELTLGYDPANPAAAYIVAARPSPPATEGVVTRLLPYLVILGCFALGARALGLF